MLRLLRRRFRRDLGRRAGDQLHAANVQERLVDREPLDEWRGALEHLEDAKGNKVDVPPLQVDVRNHDDLPAIVERVKAKGLDLFAMS